jgi:hypothetical protein
MSQTSPFVGGPAPPRTHKKEAPNVQQSQHGSSQILPRMMKLGMSSCEVKSFRPEKTPKHKKPLIQQSSSKIWKTEYEPVNYPELSELRSEFMKRQQCDEPVGADVPKFDSLDFEDYMSHPGDDRSPPTLLNQPPPAPVSSSPSELVPPISTPSSPGSDSHDSPEFKFWHHPPIRPLPQKPVFYPRFGALYTPAADNWTNSAMPLPDHVGFSHPSARRQRIWYHPPRRGQLATLGPIDPIPENWDDDTLGIGKLALADAPVSEIVLSEAEYLEYYGRPRVHGYLKGGMPRDFESDDDDLIDDYDADPDPSTSSSDGSDVQPCWRFARGSCTYGKKCKFSHLPSVLAMPIPVCDDYLKSKCKRKNCMYQHTRPKKVRFKPDVPLEVGPGPPGDRPHSPPPPGDGPPPPPPPHRGGGNPDPPGGPAPRGGPPPDPNGPPPRRPWVHPPHPPRRNDVLQWHRPNALGADVPGDPQDPYYQLLPEPDETLAQLNMRTAAADAIIGVSDIRCETTNIFAPAFNTKHSWWVCGRDANTIRADDWVLHTVPTRALTAAMNYANVTDTADPARAMAVVRENLAFVMRREGYVCADPRKGTEVLDLCSFAAIYGTAGDRERSKFRQAASYVRPLPNLAQRLWSWLPSPIQFINDSLDSFFEFALANGGLPYPNDYNPLLPMPYKTTWAGKTFERVLARHREMPDTAPDIQRTEPDHYVCQCNCPPESADEEPDDDSIPPPPSDPPSSDDESDDSSDTDPYPCSDEEKEERDEVKVDADDAAFIRGDHLRQQLMDAAYGSSDDDDSVHIVLTDADVNFEVSAAGGMPDLFDPYRDSAHCNCDLRDANDLIHLANLRESVTKDVALWGFKGRRPGSYDLSPAAIARYNMRDLHVINHRFQSLLERYTVFLKVSLRQSHQHDFNVIPGTKWSDLLNDLNAPADVTGKIGSTVIRPTDDLAYAIFCTMNGHIITTTYGLPGGCPPPESPPPPPPLTEFSPLRPSSSTITPQARPPDLNPPSKSKPLLGDWAVRGQVGAADPHPTCLCESRSICDPHPLCLSLADRAALTANLVRGVNAYPPLPPSPIVITALPPNLALLPTILHLNESEYIYRFNALMGQYNREMDSPKIWATAQKTIQLTAASTNQKPMRLPVNATIQVRNTFGTKRAGTIYYAIGPVCMANPAQPFAKHAYNELVALTTRHLRNEIDDHDDVTRRWDRLINEELANVMGPRELYDRCHQSVTSWILEQPSFKRPALIKAALGDVAWSLPKHHKLSGFLKFELIVPEPAKAVHQSRPRLINAMQRPELNLALGVICHRGAKGLAGRTLAAHETGEYPLCCYASGSDAVGLGKWFHHQTQRAKWFLEIDLAEFDSSQGSGCHHLEVAMLEYLGISAMEAAAIAAQASTVGSTNNWRYSIPYTKKSGSANTALGNVLIMFLATIYVAKKLGIFDQVLSILGMGDDNVTSLACDFTPHLPAIAAGFAELGLKIKIKCLQRPGFCSGFFVPASVDDQDSHLFVPDVRRVISKHGLCLDPVSDPAAHFHSHYCGMPALSILPLGPCFHANYVTGYKGRAPARDTNGFYKPKFHVIAGHSLIPNRATHRAYAELMEMPLSDLYKLDSYLSAVFTIPNVSAYSHPLLTQLFNPNATPPTPNFPDITINSGDPGYDLLTGQPGGPPIDLHELTASLCARPLTKRAARRARMAARQHVPHIQQSRPVRNDYKLVVLPPPPNSNHAQNTEENYSGAAPQSNPQTPHATSSLAQGPTQLHVPTAGRADRRRGNRANHSPLELNVLDSATKAAISHYASTILEDDTPGAPAPPTNQSCCNLSSKSAYPPASSGPARPADPLRAADLAKQPNPTNAAGHNAAAAASACTTRCPIHLTSSHQPPLTANQATKSAKSITGGMVLASASAPADSSPSRLRHSPMPPRPHRCRPAACSAESQTAPSTSIPPTVTSLPSTPSSRCTPSLCVRVRPPPSRGPTTASSSSVPSNYPTVVQTAVQSVAVGAWVSSQTQSSSTATTLLERPPSTASLTPTTAQTASSPSIHRTATSTGVATVSRTHYPYGPTSQTLTCSLTQCSSSASRDSSTPSTRRPKRDQVHPTTTANGSSSPPLNCTRSRAQSPTPFPPQASSQYTVAPRNAWPPPNQPSATTSSRPTTIEPSTQTACTPNRPLNLPPHQGEQAIAAPRRRPRLIVLNRPSSTPVRTTTSLNTSVPPPHPHSLLPQFSNPPPPPPHQPAIPPASHDDEAKEP